MPDLPCEEELVRLHGVWERTDRVRARYEAALRRIADHVDGEWVGDTWWSNCEIAREALAAAQEGERT